ncbi:hypothetical protein ACFQ2Y_18495 [Streptomyces malaysiensis subsp. malaysiensis]
MAAVRLVGRAVPPLGGAGFAVLLGPDAEDIRRAVVAPLMGAFDEGAGLVPAAVVAGDEEGLVHQRLGAADRGRPGVQRLGLRDHPGVALEHRLAVRVEQIAQRLVRLLGVALGLGPGEGRAPAVQVLEHLLDGPAAVGGHVVALGGRLGQPPQGGVPFAAGGQQHGAVGLAFDAAERGPVLVPGLGTGRVAGLVEQPGQAERTAAVAVGGRAVPPLGLGELAAVLMTDRECARGVRVPGVCGPGPPRQGLVQASQAGQMFGVGPVRFRFPSSRGGPQPGLLGCRIHRRVLR